jgi:hypothetical protein
MLAVGCVQALTCDSNKCPTGVTTMNPKRTVGLVIADKAPRVQHYQERTVYSLNELLAAAGLRSVKEVKRWHVYRRVSQTAVQQLSERYPYIPEHSLKKEPYPPGWSEIVKASTAESFSGNGRTVD